MNEDEKEIAREYYKELMEQESVVLTAVSALVGLVPAVISWWLIVSGGKRLLPVFLILIPAVIIGVCVKFGGGKPFRPWVQAIPGYVTVVMMLVLWFLFGLSNWYVFLAIPAGVLATIVGRPTLTERQKLAYYRVKRGLVKL